MKSNDVSFFKSKSWGSGLNKILKDLKLNWDVDEVLPIEDLYKKKDCKIKFYEHKGIIRTDTCHPLSIMGKRYRIVQNSKIMEILLSSIDKNKLTHIDKNKPPPIEGGFFKYGKRAWATIKGHEIEISGFSEKIFDEILLEWSHNGEAAISFKFISKLLIPIDDFNKKVILSPFIPGTDVPSGIIKFKHTGFVKEKLKESYKEAKKFYIELENFYNKLYKDTSFDSSQMARVLHYLYPDPEDIRQKEDGTYIIPSNKKRRDSIMELNEKFSTEYNYSKFFATLAFNYYFDHCSPVRIFVDIVDRDKVEKERRLMSSFFGTAHTEKIRFLKAINLV